MSIRFAGSRSVDERRRRRLAAETDALPVTSPTRAARRLPREAPPDEERLPRGSSPADTLISPRWWKHALVALACTLAWGGMLLLGDRVDRTEHPLAAIVGLRTGHLARFFSTVMLLAAGQLAFINLWYRSRSRKDFNGSYKVWFYTAVGWLGVCAFTATGSHWTLADALLGGRPIAIWNGRLMLWLIPGAIVVTTLYRLLLREMRDCRLSLWLLRVSAGAASAAATAVLLGPFAVSPRWQLLFEVGGSTAWHLLLALSMLLHARHVIHVTNEPPHSPLPSWRWRFPPLGGRFSFRRTTPPQKSSAAPSTGKTKSASRTSRGRATAQEQPPVRPRPGSREPRPPSEEEGSAVVSAEEEPVSRSGPSSHSQTKPQAPMAGGAKSSLPAGTAPAGAARRIDPPQAVSPRPQVVSSPRPRPDDAPACEEEEDDPDDETFEYRRLSKKERRRLRQLQKVSSAR